MKDSGIDWIGKIPDEWEVCKLKYLLKTNLQYGANSSGIEFNENLPRYVRITDIKSSEALYEKGKLSLSEEDSIGYLLQDGDILFARSGATVGKTFLYHSNIGKAAFAGYLIRAQLNENLNPKFLSYYTLSSGYDEWKNRIFIQATIQNIGADKYANMEIPLPPLSEQIKIANFLDKKCAQIDSIIEESKKSIEEYKSWKQSMIFEAVTGKNLRCKKKDSGIEWLGEIPEEWEVQRFKSIIDSFEKGNGITKEEVFSDGDTFCVRYGEIYSKYDNSFENCFSKTFKDKIPVKKYFSNGGLLFVGTGELVEEIGKCVAYLGNEHCLAGGDIIIAKHKQNAKFLSYAMNSHYVQAQKSCNKAKLKVVHISATEIGNVLLALPPISEQESIAKFLDAKCAQIDSLISEKQSLIKDLAEYKKSLIFEAVTGKRRV